MFADYEILQPFAQLGRPVMALTDEERAQTVLERFGGVRLPAVRVFALEKRGWRRSDPADAGSQNHMLRELPDGRTVVADLHPGLSIGAIAESADQEFERVWISEPVAGYTGYVVRSRTGGTPFSALDPITASEILRDLTEVTTL
jgi:hypothetical protein